MYSEKERVKRKNIILSRLDVEGPIMEGMDSPCFEYMGGRFNTGYGQVSWEGKTWLAHRLIWFLMTEEHPKKSLVLHKCNNPICCRLSHLYLGTHADNTHDSMIAATFHQAGGLPYGID